MYHNSREKNTQDTLEN